MRERGSRRGGLVAPLLFIYGGRLTSAMTDFLDFIDSCNLIDPPLEGGHFTWSSHAEVPVVS